jgi:uncharacterized protein involved in exopolysaccharide biosynthesis
MDEHRLVVREAKLPLAPVSNSSREILLLLFRQRRLLVASFLATFAGALIAVLLFGIKYQAETQILVKHRRADTVVSAELNSQEHDNNDLPTEREINTEISLLQSADLLEGLVKSAGLDSLEDHFWNSWIPGRDKDWRIAKAMLKLEKDLRISEVPQSNIIRVQYSSRHPQLAARVLKGLDTRYLEKHLQVHRPPAVFGFFQEQTQHYQQELSQAEAQLASFDLENHAADPDIEKEILLRKTSDFDTGLQQTRADIAQTSKRIVAIENEIKRTPARLQAEMTTGDNPQLLANLKSSLQSLESSRTELLTKYQPGYRLVRELDKQIADARAAIEAEAGRPVRQESSDRNPTYDLLQAELVKAKADLSSFRARAAATAPMVRTYSQQAMLVTKKGLQQQDLIRDVKSAESNYLLYLQKQEQARISDALDSNRILNVAIAEAPVVPVLPAVSPSLLVLAGGVLAVMMSLGLAFLADYLDSSFRTPEEVVRYLEIPVLASFAKNGFPPRFALPSADDDGALSASSGIEDHKALASE